MAGGCRVHASTPRVTRKVSPSPGAVAGTGAPACWAASACVPRTSPAATASTTRGTAAAAPWSTEPGRSAAAACAAASSPRCAACPRARLAAATCTTFWPPALTD
ncbi:cryptic protein [Sorex araneus]|uniref:cryptic protein n=1 Tax=Sorex araneus TaxID=42254 RepID=UPI0024334A5B|nr:cryptic protein [Sorex araneus]